MLAARDRAHREIAGLVENYRRLDARAIRAYNEANTCKDFILPLFRALGWDVHSSAEVSAERKVSRGRVDYAFRLGGIPKFFLEAKRFRVDLNEPKWARQVINYAWIKGVTWAVLSDFERLKVFNAEWKEANPVRNIFIDVSYDQYLDEFDRLWLLSKEAMAEGRIDQEALRVGKKLKKSPVGDQLFGEMVRWREKLHYYLRRYNPDFSNDQIDEAVQRILDRLIFIRTCEDRGIEAPTLRSLLREWRDRGGRTDLVKLLSGVFRDFDEGYDARLFAPHFSEELSCEPGPFEEVIEGLYATKDGIIEYDFNAIDVDVLGGIYEQYLGYVAKVVERREKREEPLTVEVIERKGWRKKHGIYYTPQFVVRYIVANTLGKLLEERSYNEVKQLKVLDPACGSGSFLIEAFDVLDKYHRRVRGDYDEFDFFRRAEILTGNIYGVDLDAQALEIARLNLLLKTLNQRAQLPDLVNNIRQGNSLISGTPEELQEYFGENWEEKRPFNWEEEFSQIMAAGGFDVVIGNPPYVSFGLRRAKRAEKGFDRYLRDKYPNSAEYKLSTYAIFINRGLELLKEGGYFGFIVPDSFLLGRYFSRLRRYILDSCAIKEIILFAEDFWPSGVVGLPVILILQKVGDKLRRETNLITAELCQNPNELDKGEFGKMYSYEQSYFEKVVYNRLRLFFNGVSKRIVERMERWALPLGELCDVYSGCIGKFGQDSIKSPEKLKELVVRDKQGEVIYVDSNAELCWRPLLESGGEIDRYLIDYDGNFIYYHPDEQRRKAYAKSGFEEEKYVGEKLFLRQTGDSLIATHDDENYFCLNNMHVIHLLPDKPPYNLKYILALLNSKFMNHYYHLISLELGRAMAQTDIETIEKLPIRRIDFDNRQEKKMHDDLVALVERMLELNKRLRDAVGREREELERKIERTDGEIDEAVYGLYGITGGRKIIEGA